MYELSLEKLNTIAGGNQDDCLVCSMPAISNNLDTIMQVGFGLGIVSGIAAGALAGPVEGLMVGGAIVSMVGLHTSLLKMDQTAYEMMALCSQKGACSVAV